MTVSSVIVMKITNEKIDAACEVLKGTFVTNSSEREKFCRTIF